MSNANTISAADARVWTRLGTMNGKPIMGWGTPEKTRAKRGSVKAEKFARRRQREQEHAAIESRLIRTGETFSFVTHVETPNPVNGAHGSHWRVSAIRQKQRDAVTSELLIFGMRRPTLPCVVAFTRVSRHVLDDDNLRPSLKILRDSIARWLNVDDGETDKVTFEYFQERGPYAVRVEIRAVQP